MVNLIIISISYMNRHRKSPSSRVLPRYPSPCISRDRTPSKAIARPKPPHKHTVSTPVPDFSTSPSRGSSLKKKPSQNSISYQKADLRKGIFSNKQVFCKKGLELPRKPAKDVESGSGGMGNKFQVLSREFKIDRNGLKGKKTGNKDHEGFYIPEKPPLMHETNVLLSNR
jgi:hypothetical protein